MLKLTKRADYGMMAMRYLAEHAAEGKAHSARDIADAYNIPLPVLAKTLQTLARAELVASQHGAMGGYALARSPRGLLHSMSSAHSMDHSLSRTARPSTVVARCLDTAQSKSRCVE